MPIPRAEEVLSVHLRVPSRAPGGCVALAQRPTWYTSFPDMPDCVTPKRQRNTLLCFCVFVGVYARVRVCVCVYMYVHVVMQPLLFHTLIFIFTINVYFYGVCPATLVHVIITTYFIYLISFYLPINCIIILYI